MKKIRQTQCPSCKKKGLWLTGDYAPFCSERCKLVDLGKWLKEENKISESLSPDHFLKYGDLPPGEYLDKPEEEK